MVEGIKAFVIKISLYCFNIFAEQCRSINFSDIPAVPKRSIPFLCFHINGDMKDLDLNYIVLRLKKS